MVAKLLVLPRKALSNPVRKDLTAKIGSTLMTFYYVVYAGEEVDGYVS